MKSIRIKILLVVFIIIIVTLGTQSYLSLNRTRRSLNSSVNKTLEIVTSKAEQQILDLNSRHFAMLRAIAKLPDFQNSEVSPRQKNQVITNLKDIDPAVYVSIAFYDNEGFFFNEDYQTRMDFSDQEYVKQALKGNEFISEPIIFRMEDLADRAESGEKIQQESEATVLMFYSEPVYNTKNEIDGALVAIINGACFKDIVRGIDMGDGHHPAIVARNTAQVFGYAKNENESYVNLNELFEDENFANQKAELLAGKTSSTNIIYPGTNKKTILSYIPVQGTTWSLLSAVPYDYYFKEISYIINYSIIGLVISIIGAFLVLIPLIRAIVRPLNTVSRSINDIAQGNADLTKRIEISSKDEVGSVVLGFNNFTDKLQEILKSIKKSQTNLENVGVAMDASTQDTSASITQIIANIQSVRNQIVNQGQSVDQTVAAINEIAENIQGLEKLIINQANGVSTASASIEEMMSNIESVNRSVDKMAASFDKLMEDTKTGSNKQAEVGRKIEQIVMQSKMLQEANTVISNIATRTNLLAMNAAIEASHAGEAGKGFSVVAGEIRKLSETSTAQSKTIGEQLSNIEESIQEVVTASKESNSAFVSVADTIEKTDEIVRSIKAAMEEQTIGSQQINQALHEMNESTVEVQTASREMADSNQNVLSEVEVLKETSLQMRQSMEEMSIGAGKINETGSELSDISSKLKNSIKEIGNEIDLFKV